MTTSKIKLATLGLLVAITTAFILGCKETTHAQPQPTHSGFAVIELFTSEGCSSCPPADALMASIAQSNADQPVYVLAFHVDYWDHQGWRDRFSDHRFTQRQRLYRTWLGPGSLYTPQVVINGTTEFVGSDREAIQETLASALQEPAAPTLTLKARLEQGKAMVEYAYNATTNGQSMELVLALVQKNAESQVRAGENMGRKLHHAQVVRQMVAVPVDLAKRKQATLDLPADFSKQGWEIIGFVQHLADGHIVDAARFDLETLNHTDTTTSVRNN